MGEVDVSYGTILVLGGGYRAETWIKAGQNALAYGLSSAGAGSILTGISSEKFYFSKNVDISNILYTRGVTFGNYGQSMVLPYTRGSSGEYLKILSDGTTTWANINTPSPNFSGTVIAENLSVSKTLDISSIIFNDGGDFSGNFIPTQDEVYDIGSVEYKIKDIYLSEGSIWLGDQNKIDVSSGTLQFKQRKTNAVPRSILTAAINATNKNLINELQVINDSVNQTPGASSLSDLTLKDWLAYARSLIPGIKNKGIRTKIEDIYAHNDDDWEHNTAGTGENSVKIRDFRDISSSLNTTDTFRFKNNLDVSNTLVSKDISCTNIVCSDISCISIYFTKFSVPENTLNPNFTISDACNNRNIIQTVFDNFEVVEGYNDAVIGIGTGTRSNKIRNASLYSGTYTPSILDSSFNSYVSSEFLNNYITNCSFDIDLSANGYYNMKVTVNDSSFGLLLTGSFMDYFTGITNFNLTINPSSAVDIISIYKPLTKTITINAGVYKFDSLINEIVTNNNFNSPDVTWDTLDNLFPQSVEIKNNSIHPYKLSGNFITYWTGNTSYTCPGRGLGEYGKRFMIRSNTFNSVGTMINDSVINTSTLNCTNLNVTNDVSVDGDITIQGTGTIGGQNITSDKRLKHNVKDISNALTTINRLEPKTYFKTKTLVDDSSSCGRKEAGYLAQDISDNISDLSFIVQEHNDTILSLDYNSIQPYLCKAIQELHKLVTLQQNEIEKLKNKLAVIR